MAADRPKPDRRGKETEAAALRRKVAELTARLDETEATLTAIRNGEVDALVVSTPAGGAVYTLKGADQAYRIFLEDMGDGAVTLTQDGLVLYANRRLAELVGVPLEQVIGSTIFRFMTPEDGSAFRQSLSTASITGTRREASFETPCGKVPVILSLNALPDSDPPACCMVVTDLSERERAHQMMVDAHRAVAESERRFRLLVDSSLVGFFIATEGQIVFANAEQKRIFGSLPIPSPVRELRNVLPQDWERFERLCDAESVGAAGVVETDIRFVMDNGEETPEGPLWVHCRAAAIDFQGKKGVLVNMVDVTRNREMEEIAINLEKMASLGQIATSIAHNIRNPLSGIYIYLFRLRKLIEDASGIDERTREEAENSLEMLQQTSGKIATVIRQVLDFVKPSSSAVQTHVIGAIREALELCRTHMNRHGIVLEMAVPDGLPPCFAGPGLLQQVFMNVINNAAQALEDQPGERKITVSGSYEGGFIVVQVADSGPGIPERLREKIFEPFYTTRQQGTGIGLAFGRRILDGMGGSIEVDESPLGGAAFRIRIPASDRREDPRET